MRLLDLFCCAGGAAAGYNRVGFDEIVGVDIEPQPNYPFEFVQGDGLKYLAEHGHDFDAIHASPPCQAQSALKRLHQHRDSYAKHINLIPETRALLREIGRPYIIENVVGAELENPVMLCGAQFGLKVYRHRLFECSFSVVAPPHYPHRDQTPSAGRGKSPKGFLSVCGKGGFGFPGGWAYAQAAMGIDWMTRAEVSQAIPPAFTEYLGKRLRAYIEAQVLEQSNNERESEFETQLAHTRVAFAEIGERADALLGEFQTVFPAYFESLDMLIEKTKEAQVLAEDSE